MSYGWLVTSGASLIYRDFKAFTYMHRHLHAGNPTSASVPFIEEMGATNFPLVFPLEARVFRTVFRVVFDLPFALILGMSFLHLNYSAFRLALNKGFRPD